MRRGPRRRRTRRSMSLRDVVEEIFPEWERWYPSLFDAAADLGVIRARVCPPSQLLLSNRHSGIRDEAIRAFRERWSAVEPEDPDYLRLARAGSDHAPVAAVRVRAACRGGRRRPRDPSPLRRRLRPSMPTETGTRACSVPSSSIESMRMIRLTEGCTPGSRAGSCGRRRRRGRPGPVVVGDEVAQRRRVALLGGGFGLVHQRADFLFRRARVTAAGERQDASTAQTTQEGLPLRQPSVISNQAPCWSRRCGRAASCRAHRRGAAGCDDIAGRFDDARQLAAALAAEGLAEALGARQRETRDFFVAANPASCSVLKKAFVACAALRARRQREQWQFCRISGRPANSQATSPQRQLPWHNRVSGAAGRRVDDRPAA